MSFYQTRFKFTKFKSSLTGKCIRKCARYPAGKALRSFPAGKILRVDKHQQAGHYPTQAQTRLEWATQAFLAGAPVPKGGLKVAQGREGRLPSPEGLGNPDHDPERRKRDAYVRPKALPFRKASFPRL
jgi:hypothetical protein